MSSREVVLILLLIIVNLSLILSWLVVLISPVVVIEFNDESSTIPDNVNCPAVTTILAVADEIFKFAPAVAFIFDATTLVKFATGDDIVLVNTESPIVEVSATRLTDVNLPSAISDFIISITSTLETKISNPEPNTFGLLASIVNCPPTFPWFGQ